MGEFDAYCQLCGGPLYNPHATLLNDGKASEISIEEATTGERRMLPHEGSVGAPSALRLASPPSDMQLVAQLGTHLGISQQRDPLHEQGQILLARDGKKTVSPRPPSLALPTSDDLCHAVPLSRP